VDDFDSGSDGSDADGSDDSGNLYQSHSEEEPVPGRRRAASAGCLVEDLELSTPRSSRGGSTSHSTKETPHFSETGTFHSDGFLVDAGGYRPSPAHSEAASTRSYASTSTRESKLRSRESKTGFNTDEDDCDNTSADASFSSGHTSSRHKRDHKKLSSEFVELYELGRGAGGRVFKAIHVPSLTPVALKRIKCNSPEKLENLGQEIKALGVNFLPLTSGTNA